ncbi:hypothetical protein C0J52_11669 [Blattella germanica]|nr:hypothetical protein C0J52_11669 [Blattella germanica]
MSLISIHIILEDKANITWTANYRCSTEGTYCIKAIGTMRNCNICPVSENCSELLQYNRDWKRNLTATMGYCVNLDECITCKKVLDVMDTLNEPQGNSILHNTVVTKVGGMKKTLEYKTPDEYASRAASSDLSGAWLILPTDTGMCVSRYGNNLEINIAIYLEITTIDVFAAETKLT